MKKMVKVVTDIVMILVFLSMIWVAFLALSSRISGSAPALNGYELKSVLSGSMEPEFLTGSVIAIKQKDDGTVYQKGDVITFRLPDQTLVTHRIVSVTKAGDGQAIYETKGDANDGPDLEPVLHQNVVGKYSGFTIPYAGYILNYTSSKTGAALTLVLPGIVLIAYSIFSFFGTWKQLQAAEKDSAH